MHSITLVYNTRPAIDGTDACSPPVVKTTGLRGIKARYLPVVKTTGFKKHQSPQGGLHLDR